MGAGLAPCRTQCFTHPTARSPCRQGEPSPLCASQSWICGRSGSQALLKGSVQGGGVWRAGAAILGIPRQQGPCIPASASLHPWGWWDWHSWAWRFGEHFPSSHFPQFCCWVSLLCFSCRCPGYSHAISLSAKAAPERTGALGSLHTLPPEPAVPAITSHFKALPLPALPPAAGPGGLPPPPALWPGPGKQGPGYGWRRGTA